MKIRLPDNWTEIVADIKPYGRYGYYRKDIRTITIYKPKFRWLLFRSLRDVVGSLVVSIVRRHERAHAWGIDGCSKPWCMSFEASSWSRKWKDPWWEILFAWVVVFNFFSFCRWHKRHLINVKATATGGGK